MNEKEYKVAQEVAEQEFNRFLESMDLDFDESVMSSEDLEGYTRNKFKLIKAIKRGDLIINDNGEAVYTPRNPGSGYKEPITFHERTGASLTASDGVKDGHNVKKMYAILGSLCKLPQKTFAGLCGTDIKICEALFVLLMD